MKTVHITGMGWVTPAGSGWGNGGECSFINAPLPALTRRDVFPEPNQRFGRMSAYAKLGLAAITFALRDAGLEQWSDKRAMGMIASSRLGCLATDLEYNDTVLLHGGGLASPNLFAYTLANCFLGDAAIQFGLTGSGIVINETGDDSLDAIRMAIEELESGEAETMLAGICDLPVPGAYAESVTLKPGALFLVLSVNPDAERGRYGSVSLAAGGVVCHNDVEVGTLEELVKKVQKLRPGKTGPSP